MGVVGESSSGLGKPRSILSAAQITTKRGRSSEILQFASSDELVL